ncbi:MAG: nitrate/nitrite transporter NrtS [Cycloclasticus sp.]
MILKALKVAIIVGSALLLINQYDALFGTAEFRWLAAFLTYCVPYIVFIFGQKSSISAPKTPSKFNSR